MVSLTAEPIVHFGSFTVTNTIIDTIFVDLFLITAIIIIRVNLSKIPNFFQNIIEFMIQTFYDLTESIAGKNAQRIFPFFMTFFIFILIANWSELIPGFSSFGIKSKNEIIPLFRSTTSDLNATLAFALISASATHILSVKTLGIKKYLGRYFFLNPINLFVGILEIISEITKVVSLSFRLFGNIFAGGVVLGIISGIFAIIVPLPFLFLEILVGFVQALIFAMLTMVFMSILITPAHSEEVKTL